MKVEEQAEVVETGAAPDDGGDAGEKAQEKQA
jgi:hypothetical protein